MGCLVTIKCLQIVDLLTKIHFVSLMYIKSISNMPKKKKDVTENINCNFGTIYTPCLPVVFELL